MVLEGVNHILNLTLTTGLGDQELPARGEFWSELQQLDLPKVARKCVRNRKYHS